MQGVLPRLLAMAIELESTGIKVNAASPGFTKTNLNNNSELPPNRMWTIFQPNGDREGHDRSRGLP